MIRRADPPRLRAPGSGASAAARAVLAASRAEVPSGDQLARLAQRLPLQFPAGIGSHPPAPPPVTPHLPAPPLVPPVPQAAAASILPSVVVGASLALAVMTGAWWREADTPSPAPAARPVAAVHHEAKQERGSVALPPPPPNESKPLDAPKRAAPSAVAAAPSNNALPSRAADQEAEKPVADSPGSLGGGEGVGSGSVTEIELLQRAQQALPRDAARALGTAEEHLRRFPGGALAQEREVIAISALIALGRQGEAQRRATRFLESYPRSAHRPGIEALVPALAAERLEKKNDPGRAPIP